MLTPVGEFGTAWSRFTFILLDRAGNLSIYSARSSYGGISKDDLLKNPAQIGLFKRSFTSHIRLFQQYTRTVKIPRMQEFFSKNKTV